MIHYPVPPHLQPAYHELGYRRGDFPVSEAIHDEILSLPMGPHLDDTQVDYVIDTIRKA
jgi:dTDP-4-amino-4,6-dideoxygalactose transaminase